MTSVNRFMEAGGWMLVFFVGVWLVIYATVKFGRWHDRHTGRSQDEA